MDLELIMVGIEFPKERLEEANQELLQNQLALYDIRKHGHHLRIMDLHTPYYWLGPDGRLLIGYIQTCADREAGENLPSLMNLNNIYSFFWTHCAKLNLQLVEKCDKLGLLQFFSGDQYGIFYIHVEE